MIPRRPAKPVVWMGDSRRAVREFPEPVQDAVGFALWQAQLGTVHRRAKPLKGFGGANVLEIVDDHDGNAYRAVYTVRFDDGVYVLHAFHKKSKRGIATPPGEMEVVRARLKLAEALHAERTGKGTQR